jgi:hypothetical protein
MTIAEASQPLRARCCGAIPIPANCITVTDCRTVADQALFVASPQKKNSENNLRVHRTNEKRRSIGAAFILSEGFGRFKASL